MTRATLTPLRVLAAFLAVGSIALLLPLWVPLVLAAWSADLLLPSVHRLERALGARRRAAAATIVLLIVVVLLPVAGVTVALAAGVRDLLVQVRAALEGQGSLGAALLGGGSTAPHLGVRDWTDLVSRYGASVWSTASTIARASASAAIAVLVYVAALFALLVDGSRAYAWMESHVPIPRDAISRLAGAFRETGRGLLIAGGGTALAQGAAATLAYVAIGIPRALLLGPLTALCAIVPVIGTGLVWVPLAIELALAGQLWRAAVVVAVGAGVHSMIDNFVRPALARYGRLSLPTFLVLVSMLGGVAVFGAAGALLGPLLVRLCVEALAIVSEERDGRSVAAGGNERGAT
jgi:predicted PurR-regulated permease PerM